MLFFYNATPFPLQHAIYSSFSLLCILVTKHLLEGCSFILFFFFFFSVSETASRALSSSTCPVQAIQLTCNMLGNPHHHHAPDVSSPVLHYTNAVQRNDLQTLAATTMSDQHASDPRTISLLGLQRPRTSEGRDRRPNLRIAIPPMDDLPLPPVIHDGGYESDGSNLIGIALGSPRLVHRRNGAQAEQQHHKNEKRRYHPALEKPKRPLQRKPSKWRKIGGLFKHKNAAPNQVRNHKHKPPGCGGEPDSGVEDKGNCFGGGTGGKIKSCLEAKRRLKAENANASTSANAKSAARNADASKGDDSAPMLEVDIPDAQMERYSVMFGGLFGQGKPGLLSRRSKTMDEVIASSRVCF